MTAFVSSPKTQLTDEDVRQILRAYRLVLRTFEPIPRGTINSNYKVHTDEGPLFLRVCEGKSPAQCAFEADLIWRLGSHGVPTPALWRTPAGQPVLAASLRPATGSPQPKPVMLFSWVGGRELDDASLDETHAYYVGELLARMHLALSGVGREHPGIYTLRHIQGRLHGLRHDDACRADVGPVLDELSAEAAWLTRSRRRDLPTGMGHGDLFLDNLLFPRRKLRRRPSAGTTVRPDDTGWILDLEQAATLPYAYDLAISLLACCAPIPTELAAALAATELPAADAESARASDPPPAADAPLAPDADAAGPLRLSTARAMLAGYQSLRALSPTEWAGLYAELRCAALRSLVF